MEDDNQKTVRELIQYENEMMNHRITWLNVIQGLLFTAVGAVLGKNDTKPLIFVIAFLAICVTVISIIALFVHIRR